MKTNEHASPAKLIALICTLLVVPGDPHLFAQDPAPAAQPAAQEQPARPSLTPDQIDSLVAPIALYSDPLLAQVLAASTYPLEVVEAARWLKANSTLQNEALTSAAQKQDWDPSVQALVAFPDALKRLDENIKWTTDLGNAFLDNQEAVMDAVQRMRVKAQNAGALQSTKEQKVEPTVVENKTVIQIQPADPQVIYVPQYNPTVVYGPPVYPYPPIYYPPPPTGAIVAATMITFGMGIALGAYWGGCCGGYGWGWGCHWGGGGHNTVIINNNFHNRYNYHGGSYGNRVGNGNQWNHDSAHRRAVPYDNKNTAQKFGGAARGPDGKMQRYDRPGGNGGSRDFNRPQTGNRDINRPQAGTRDINRPQTGGADKVGSRNIPQRDRSKEGAFGGMESRNKAQAASDRGFSSARPKSGQSRNMSKGGGGGRSAGGGASRGGGGRSGGGGGRKR
jgi:uncharacterized membrane protein YgcG